MPKPHDWRLLPGTLNPDDRAHTHTHPPNPPKPTPTQHNTFDASAGAPAPHKGLFQPSTLKPNQATSEMSSTQRAQASEANLRADPDIQAELSNLSLATPPGHPAVAVRSHPR